MTTEWAIEKALAAASLGPAKSITPLNSGAWASVYKIDLAEGDPLAVKAGRKGFENLMVEEGRMLEYLADKTGVPFPRVRGLAPGFLFLDFIENDGARGAPGSEAAGRALAELHSVTSGHYGFAYDTVFATVDQPNRESENWVQFFAEQRLLYMGRIALDAGQITSDLMKRLVKFCDNLDKYLPAAPKPVLLHGDFWGGNLLFHQGRLAAFIDPAIYYGDAEADLAFSTLFGSLGDAFFGAYAEVHPLDSGFTSRIDIYNLWPLLFHAFWFDSSYTTSIDGILSRHGY